MPKNKFIEDEAELSGTASDDELDNEEMDAFDESFVDDATQRDDLDQRAVYLQSIRYVKLELRSLRQKCLLNLSKIK